MAEDVVFVDVSRNPQPPDLRYGLADVVPNAAHAGPGHNVHGLGAWLTTTHPHHPSCDQVVEDAILDAGRGGAGPYVGDRAWQAFHYQVGAGVAIVEGLDTVENQLQALFEDGSTAVPAPDVTHDRILGDLGLGLPVAGYPLL